MIGVYGDMLAFFSELFEDFVTFTMQPKPVAGFNPRQNERTISGVFQFVKSGDIQFEAKTSVDVSYPTFWTYEKLEKDSYLLHPDGTMYRRVKPNDWTKQGSFYVYIMESVAGVDGRQSPNPVVDGGKSRYA